MNKQISEEQCNRMIVTAECCIKPPCYTYLVPLFTDVPKRPLDWRVVGGGHLLWSQRTQPFCFAMLRMELRPLCMPGSALPLSYNTPKPKEGFLK
jgi:hypothetical protein